MPELIAEQLSFSYGDKSLLHDIALTLRSGELVVCLGGNGSGKTTLLRLLSGLLSPGAGRVFVRGSSNYAVRNQVGILFQNPDHQMLAATVEEEIALGLELRGTPPPVIREMVDLYLDRFRLRAFKHHPPQALSGGQKQRVALAAIMVSKPGFLLLDEPDSYLDAPSRSEFMVGVAEVRDECGLLWTMPHPRSMPFADRYCLLSDGRLCECLREDLVKMSNALSAQP